jgi:hypothetical protein
MRRTIVGTAIKLARWLDSSSEAKMKNIIVGLAAVVLLSSAATAEEGTTQQPAQPASAIEDCSKQVWPHFSPSCLRNADRAVSVRLVTATRR